MEHQVPKNSSSLLLKKRLCICLYVFLLACLPACLYLLSIYLSICLAVCLSIYVYIYIYILSVSLSDYVAIYHSSLLSVRSFICPPKCLYTNLYEFIHLSVFVSFSVYQNLKRRLIYSISLSNKFRNYVQRSPPLEPVVRLIISVYISFLKD